MKTKFKKKNLNTKSFVLRKFTTIKRHARYKNRCSSLSLYIDNNTSSSDIMIQTNKQTKDFIFTQFNIATSIFCTSIIYIINCFNLQCSYIDTHTTCCDFL